MQRSWLIQPGLTGAAGNGLRPTIVTQRSGEGRCLPAIGIEFASWTLAPEKFRHGVGLVVALLLTASVGSSPCQAQIEALPDNGQYGSYASGGRSYSPGMGGYSNTSSFNSGLSGMSRTSSGMAYSTQRSTQAAQALARQVGSIWSRMPFGNTNQGQSHGTIGGGLLPPMSKQQMLQIFFDGGTPQSGGAQAAAPSGNSSQATSTAYSNYQTAENEASKAHNDAERARYAENSWNRKDDASSAEYAANNADYAAQRAESAAYNGDSQARGYANLARAAANRARADADQARYNADTMR